MPKKTYGEECIISGHKLSLSLATEANGFVFVSGVISTDENLQPQLECGIEEQVTNTLNLIKRILKDADCEMDDIVKLNVLLKKREDLDGYNTTVSKFFSEGQEPARITTLGDFLLEGVLCEIDAIAYKG